MGSDKYPWGNVNKRDYEEFSQRLAKSKKKILGYPIIMFLVLLIGLPLLVYILVVLIDKFGPFIVLVIAFVCATIIFGTKAYRGIVRRRVRILPKSRVMYRDEAGYIGGRITEAATGAEALIAGIIFLILAFGCLWLAVKYFVIMIDLFI
jgi:hypothetical protein